MHYLLVDPQNGANGSVSMQFEGGPTSISASVNSTPLAANYRTNIYGDLFTTPEQIKISMNTSFAGVDENINDVDIDVTVVEDKDDDEEDDE